MVSYSELSSQEPRKRRLTTSPVAMPITALASRLIYTQNHISDIRLRQIGDRRGQKGNELKRIKRELRAEQIRLTQALAVLTATPKKEVTIKSIVHGAPKKNLADRLPAPLLRSLSMAGFALTLLTPGIALAEGGPTPEPTRPVTVSGRYTINLSRTEGNKVTLWTKSNGSNSTLLSLPPLNLGHVQAAIAGEYGAMVNPAGCADQIAETNISNVETMDAARARLKKQAGIYSSDRLVTIPEARMVVDLIKACALKAQQIIRTVLPTISVIPSKVAPATVMATKIPPSSTPAKLPTATSTSHTEASSTTDTTGEYIKYGLGGALVIALLGLGSFVALVIRNGKKSEERPDDSSAREATEEFDPAEVYVVQIIGRVEALSGPGEDELTLTKPAVHLVKGYRDIPHAESRYRQIMHEEIKKTARQAGIGDVPPLVRSDTITHEGDHADGYLHPNSKADGAQVGTFIRVKSTDKGVDVGVGAYAKGTGRPSDEDALRSLKAVAKPSERDKEQLKELEEKKKGKK